MTLRFGIDTSILVRLLTGDPPEGFEACVKALSTLVEEQGAEVFVSNQVLGEAYIVLQHHYGVPKAEARYALESVLTSGLVMPLGGAGVLDILGSGGGAGLLDRLIADDYRRAGLVIPTLDRRMATLPETRILFEGLRPRL